MLRRALVLLGLSAILSLPASAPAQTVEEADSAAEAARKSDQLPLVPTRSMAFTTDRGTWLHLDLSPDGETLVFEILGDLYTLPVTGGEATRITSGQAYDMQPRYSPDGRRLVFVSDRNGSENLWVAAADGSDPRPLTEDEDENHMSPEWTPEGDYVMAVKGRDLWLYHVDGGSGVQVTGHGDPAPSAIGPAFGPDDGTVWLNLRGELGGGFPTERAWEDAPDALHGRGAYAGREHGAGALQSSARQVDAFQIARLDRASGQMRIRTHETMGAFRPVPSPDGRWVVYATRYDDRPALKLLEVATGGTSWLRMDVQRDDHQGGGMRDRDVYPGSAWTPDGSALYTTWDGRIWRLEVPSGEATEVPFTARVEQELGPLVDFDYPVADDELTVSQIRGARPSPDGGRIAFTALDRLYVAELPDAGSRGLRGGDDPRVVDDARPLTGGEPVEHAPVWSPDGRWIAYVTWNDTLGGGIWRVRSDGSGEPERLTADPAFYDKLNYNGDGTRLLAVRGSRAHRMKMLEDFGSHSGASELEYVWLPADGGQPTRIAWVGGGPTQERGVPHPGPDPERIYVWDGSERLLSMRYDGTDRRTVMRVTIPEGPIHEVVLSPTGERALVRANRNAWLLTVPRVGGEPPTVAVAPSSSMPTRRLTRVGGYFIGWRPDGRVAHWSIGRSFFQHDVSLADSLVADSVAAARDEAAMESQAPPDEEGQEEVEGAGEEEEPTPAYEPWRADVEIVVPKDRPSGVVALTGARLITMRGDEVIERGDIVVRDNRIQAVGPSGTVDIPEGAEVLDMSGKTIYPGLVDVHAHAWLGRGVHRTQASQFLAQLAYGVTTHRDPQTSSTDLVTYADRMEVGDFVGPRIYSTGPGIFGSDDIDSLDEARDVLKRYSEHFNTLTIKQYLAGDRKVRQWVITAARELGLTPTTEGGSNFTMNLTLMQDGYSGLEHSLPISPFYRDVVELGAFSGLTYTPTFIVAYGGPSGRQYYLTRTEMDEVERLRTFTPHDEMDKWRSTQWHRKDLYPHFLHAEQLEKWMDAGGKAGLGSHGEVQGLGTHWELWMMASGGMDNHRALHMATLMSADAIGLDGDLGSLEPGKLADLQILDENPLDDLHHTTAISHVMKNGRLYEAATLTEVWPRQRPLPTQWWWRVEPEGVERGAR